MELTEKEINRILDQVQEYLGAELEGNFKETKITKRGTEYTCITGFANFGLTKRQAKILKADPRGIEITVVIDTKLQEGKLVLGNGYSEEVITKLTFDANYTNAKFLTTYDESKKRGTGVFLNQIKEGSGPLLPEVIDVIRKVADEYDDNDIAAAAETCEYYDSERNTVSLDISNLSEKQVWRIEDAMMYRNLYAKVHYGQNLMTVEAR